jgi:hypothetical protein
MTKEKIYIQIDDERIEATGEILKEILDRREKAKLLKESQAAEAEARATQKAALLERLGISEDEARLLLA